jgi:hypothetical protein
MQLLGQQLLRLRRQNGRERGDVLLNRDASSTSP